MPTMNRGPRQRDRYHHGDLPAALRAAALTLVAERGPRGFTLAEAARRAGVSGSAPYRHFADRDALLAAVATDAYGDLARRLVEATRGVADPGERLASMGTAYVRYAADRPAAFAVLIGAGLDKERYPALRAAGDRAFAAVVAAAQGAIVPCNPGAERALAITLWATAHGHATLMLSGELTANGV